MKHKVHLLSGLEITRWKGPRSLEETGASAGHIKKVKQKEQEKEKITIKEAQTLYKYCHHQTFLISKGRKSRKIKQGKRRYKLR